VAGGQTDLPLPADGQLGLRPAAARAA